MLRSTLRASSALLASALLVAGLPSTSQAASTPSLHPGLSTTCGVGPHMGGTARLNVGTPKLCEGVLRTGVWTQLFTNGRAFASSRGTFVVTNTFLPTYTVTGAWSGRLGLPTSNQQRLSSGWMQTFERGALFRRDGGSVQVVSGSMWTWYRAHGATAGVMGWPTGSVVTVRSGYRYQQFAYGRIYEAGSRSVGVYGPLGGVYARNGLHSGWMGWPWGDQRNIPGAATQQFAGGHAYHSPTGRTLAIRYSKLGGIQPRTGPMAFAMDQIGDRYVLGSTGPDSWDCSGLVYGAMQYSGKTVSRSTSGLRSGLPVVSRSSMRIGDILWWPGHVGIYAGVNSKGEQVLVNAMNPRDGIKVIPTYWVGGSYTVLAAPVR